MKITYEAHCVGYTVKDGDKTKASYGAYLSAVADDGRSKEFESSSILGEYNKNQADLIAVIMTLRCIHEDQADQYVTVYTPPGYATVITTRNNDGIWKTTPKSNVDLVDELRGWAVHFDNLTFLPGNKGTEQFQRCSKLAEAAHASSGD